MPQNGYPISFENVATVLIIPIWVGCNPWLRKKIVWNLVQATPDSEVRNCNILTKDSLEIVGIGKRPNANGLFGNMKKKKEKHL
jgi:hypothetical protein